MGSSQCPPLHVQLWLAKFAVIHTSESLVTLFYMALSPCSSDINLLAEGIHGVYSALAAILWIGCIVS